LEQAGIEYLDISGRPKHLYGIYQKMQQQKEFHEIYDLAAIRILVKTNEECYRALAVVHDAFRPIPGRFKDYIGLPKPNRYQSLHTSVVGISGRPLKCSSAHWKCIKSQSMELQLTGNTRKQEVPTTSS